VLDVDIVEFGVDDVYVFEYDVVGVFDVDFVLVVVYGDVM